MDECFPQRKKKKRVRDKDIPYMTTTLWKNAIRTKRKAFKSYLNDRKQKNWEDKQKNRNEAVRQRRIARWQYWKKAGALLKKETNDLRENPRNFFPDLQTSESRKKFHEIVNFCLVLLSDTKKYKNIITEIKFSV